MDIETAILERRFGLKTIGEKYGLTYQALRLHESRCMPTLEAKLRGAHRQLALRVSIEGAAANPFLLRMLAIEDAAWAIYDRCAHPGETPDGKIIPADDRNANQALSNLLKAGELIGKATGGLVEKSERKILHGGVVALAIPQLVPGEAQARPVLAAPAKTADVPSSLPAGILLEAEAIEAEIAPQEAPGRAGEGAPISQHPPKKGGFARLTRKR